GLVLDGRFETAELVQAAVEGLTIAQFDAAAYKTLNVEPFSFQAMSIIISGRSETVREAASRGQVLGESTNIARSLAHAPANRLTPAIFAERAVAIARAAGVTVETLDEARLRELGMGMLLGVGQGSNEPPRLVAMRHQPGGVPGKPVLGLVGKG